ncbi:MAG: 2OG-Fe(II) oxygenase [Caulobacteraceae bacterium]|nr:2OG-Fe(II) oxygenase [Caulobacteraceae bacterium]
MPGLLRRDECDAAAGLYESGDFRKRVVMGEHGFGQGEYKYFAYPLPLPVEELRTALYPRLAPIANRWRERLGLEPPFPPDHGAFLARCHRAGQTRPTPLMLRYGEGDFNRLHQDLYGDHVFPLQATILLSQPGEDFEGGDFVLTEQRPRMQSRVEVVPLRRGDAVVFAVSGRPAEGARGPYRVAMRHGVSTLRAGHRQSLGVIFHDAA